MKFNRGIHHRRSIRLRNHDYSSTGSYFVTICTAGRECLFGEVVGGKMQLNEAGRIAHKFWERMLNDFPCIELDAWVIMPNHVHGIVTINDHVGGRFIAPDSRNPATNNQGAMNRAPTVGEIIRVFKARCTHAINQSCNSPGVPVWQRNYYERVIRDDRELDNIRQYIADNPAKWEEDENHPARM